MDEKRRWVGLTDTQHFRYTDIYGNVTEGDAPPFGYIQTTRTRGHAWPQSRAASTDVGGDFTTAKIVGMSTNFSGTVSASGRSNTYVGTEYALPVSTAISDALALVAPSSDISLMQKGTTAIARCLPTNPVADAGTFIGELKSGLPKLVGRELFKTKLKDYRKVGSEYLNVEFGWKPLISDLQKFGTAAIESEKILNQLHRDSGKNIRRKFTFPDEIASTEGVQSNRQSVGSDGGFGSPFLHVSSSGGPMRVTTNLVTQTWFSGCFTYHLNLGTTLPDRMMRSAAEARKLFGVELTPETVWNLAPWSWAVDWEGNVGDVLHNVSRFAQDGLVMRYGYIMQSKIATTTYSLAYEGRFKSAPQQDLQLTIISQSKVRRRATPFGFGFDMTALSGRQSAILGALGISRGPRHL
jgi:hypothetical protein